MEFLDLITWILNVITIVIVVVGLLVITVLACYQVTGTWNLRQYYGNSRYWAMSILNFRYKEKKAEGLSAREFVRFFNHNYLSKGFLGMWRRLNDEERTTIVEILSNPRFIEENLGHEKYTIEIHQQITASWDELKKRHEEELAMMEENVEL